jgi:hypothetical protein
MIAVVVVAVVALVLFRGGSLGSFGGALGTAPPVGGADGSPQAQAAAAATGTTTVGNTSDSRVKLESALGGAGAAAVCTYYGAGAVAPICAKVGAKAAPYAAALGRFTTNKATDIGSKTNQLAAKSITVSTGIGLSLANRTSSLADRAYAGTGGGVVGTAGKLALAPVKIAADLGSKAASAVNTAGGALSSGIKSASNAISSGAKKVIGWL